MNFNTGGQEVMHRLLEAYGFKTRQALCDKLGVSKSTMASRYMRDIFPADWVIQASIETGVNVEWLSFGTGNKFSNENHKALKVPSLILEGGIMVEGESLLFDEKLYPSSLVSPCVLISDAGKYLLETEFEKILDGNWLLDIDGLKSVREVMRLPQQKVRVTNETGSFDCPFDAVHFIGSVVLIMHKG